MSERMTAWTRGRHTRGKRAPPPNACPCRRPPRARAAPRPLRPAPRARFLRRRLHRRPEGRRSHDIVAKGLQILENLTHRGAVGADPLVGDGAGMLIQIPHEFLQRRMRRARLRAARAAATTASATSSCRATRRCARITRRSSSASSRRRGRSSSAGAPCRSTIPRLSQSPAIKASEPFHRQVFIGRGDATEAGDAFERRLFILRKVISNVIHRGDEGHRPRLLHRLDVGADASSTRACSSPTSSAPIIRDLHDPRFASQMALVHQRFSTNTFPSWKLAHPYRMVAHNGEINTLRGNVNWMAARQASVSSPLFGDEISKLWPISYEGQSDTACFDNALEFLDHGRLRARPCGDDADPRGLGGQPAHGRGPPRFLRIPRRADGAVGRPGRDRLHRRPPDRRDARPQRPAARRATSSPTTASSSWRRRSACCRCRRRRSSPSGACSRARCC